MIEVIFSEAQDPAIDLPVILPSGQKARFAFKKDIESQRLMEDENAVQDPTEDPIEY